MWSPLIDSSSSESDEEFLVPRRRRVFKARINYTALTDFTFKEHFRVGRNVVEHLLLVLGGSLAHETERNFALSPEHQILTTLSWMGNGGQFHGIARMHGVSKSTVHRCVTVVCDKIIAKIFPEQVRWPTDGSNDIPFLFSRASNFGFPYVAGCIDGTLINIDAPTIHEEAYVDRKGNHSLNVMMVAGPNYEFYYASAKWPGSVHDARILRNSSLARKWDEGWRPFQHAVLLGDSGYGLSEWLIPPIINGPMNESARRFLRAHRSTRCIVERSFGIWKEMFPCLQHLRLKPEVAAKIVLATVTIYNLQRKLNSNDIEITENDEDDDDENAQNDDETPTATAFENLRRIMSLF